MPVYEPTTYAEFIKFPNSEKRYLVVFQAIDNLNPTAPARTFLCSNIGNPVEVPGLTARWFGIVKTVPRISQKAKDIIGDALPQWPEVVLFREDNDDISHDRSGISTDDIGRRWIVKNQSCLIYYGGGNLPSSEYKLVFDGKITGSKFGDGTISLSIAGSENLSSEK